MTRQLWLPQEEPQIPLTIKWDTKPLWQLAKDLVGVDSTGAAMIVQAHEAMRLHRSGISSCDGFVSYSRNSTKYSGWRCHGLISYRRVIRQVDYLDSSGLIEHRRQIPGGYGWQSAFAARPVLNELVSAMLDRVALPLDRSRPSIILRDADGLSMPVAATREIHRMSRKIEAINEGLTSVSVTVGDSISLMAPVSRIFNLDMKRCGRLYAAGTSWQNIRKAQRSHIQIDGEAVVELDYSTMHPAMLYAEVGAIPPADCYCIDGWDRDLVKRAVCILINAGTNYQARWAIAHCDEMKAYFAVSGQQAALTMAADLIDAIKRFHSPIASTFHTGAGGRLMRRDSDLAINIVTEMQRKGVVVLPVHDSFIAPASKEALLLETMNVEAAKMGLDLKIRKKAAP